jgi:hypothetical protein
MLCSVSRLLACPFCRTIYRRGETAGLCPECDVRLVPIQRLAPSPEALADALDDAGPQADESRVYPWTYPGRGRGLLIGLSVLGMLAFLLPWVRMTRPELVSISGYDLARGRAGWLWGGAVAWSVILPLVVSRRTITQMRGARVIVTLLAAVTLGQIVMLLAFPPRAGPVVPLAFDWSWGMYASAALSALGVLVGLRFGGSLEEPRGRTAPRPERAPGRDGQWLH